MLENFFEVTKKEQNKELFDGLYIKTSPYYSEYGKYPGIELDFKELKTDTFLKSFENYKMIISSLYTKKSYVQDVLTVEEKEKYTLFLRETTKSSRI